MSSSALDEAPALIRGHRRSGLSGVTAEAIVNKSKKLKPADVASVRESFTTMFGAATADQALRQIDRRVGSSATIKGEHVQTAAVAAMEMLSPLIRCGKAVSAAEARAGRATQAACDRRADAG